MHVGKTLFAQLMDFVPWTKFTRIVTRYGGDHRVRPLTCGEQYRAMSFAQLTHREILVLRRFKWIGRGLRGVRCLSR